MAEVTITAVAEGFNVVNDSVYVRLLGEARRSWHWQPGTRLSTLATSGNFTVGDVGKEITTHDGHKYKIVQVISQNKVRVHHV